MIQDAEMFKEEDNLLKNKVEARNSFEGYAYSLKNQIDDDEKLGGKLSEQEKDEISSAIDDAIDFLEENSDASAEEIKEAQKELESVAQPIVSKYMQPSGD